MRFVKLAGLALAAGIVLLPKIVLKRGWLGVKSSSKTAPSPRLRWRLLKLLNDHRTDFGPDKFASKPRSFFQERGFLSAAFV